MSNKDIWDYFQAQRNDAIGSSKSSAAEANQAERDLCSQLILVATVIIGATSAVLAAGVFNQTATLLQGNAGSFAVIASLSAISSAVRYYLVIISFNESWAIIHREIGLKYDAISVSVAEGNTEEYKDLVDRLRVYIDSQNERTNNAWLYIVFACLVVAGFFLASLILAVMFNWSPLAIK